MYYTKEAFNEEIKKAVRHIENAASIIFHSELNDYCFYNCKTIDDESDYKQYVMKYLEDYFWDCGNYKKSYSSYLEEILEDDEVEDLQKELYKLTGDDYSYTTFKEAKPMIIESAIFEGLI